MKICAISDLHGYLPKSLPECDVLVIAGDIVPLEYQRSTVQSVAWLAGPFQNWCLKRKCSEIVVVAGNHDFIFEHCINNFFTPREIHDILFKLDSKLKIHYLCDSYVTIKDITFYGTSLCPSLRNWAFYRDSDSLKEGFINGMNKPFDVLVTHCPPKMGTQGVVLQPNYNYYKDFGCEELWDVIKEKDIKWVISGHIHSGNHDIDYYGNMKCVNVSLKDEDYNVKYETFVFEI